MKDGCGPRAVRDSKEAGASAGTCRRVLVAPDALLELPRLRGHASAIAREAEVDRRVRRVTLVRVEERRVERR